MYQQGVSLETFGGIITAANDLIGRSEQQTAFVKIIVALTVFQFSNKFCPIGYFIKAQHMGSRWSICRDQVTGTVEEAYQRMRRLR